ncbi:hypothetical protein [Streptomyces lavendofoliae]
MHTTAMRLVTPFEQPHLKVAFPLFLDDPYRVVLFDHACGIARPPP